MLSIFVIVIVSVVYAGFLLLIKEKERKKLKYFRNSRDVRR